MTRAMARFPFDGVDPTRGPTASQAAGLTLTATRAIMAAVEAEARDIGVAMTCAVVDAGGQLVAFERMDGADLVTITLAQDKAWTALVNRMPTGDLGPLAQPGAEFYGYDSVAAGRTIIFAGGLPLEYAGVLVGGLGVSGGDSAQDAQAAEAGVRAFEAGPGS
ncbi:MAG: heme-binding protein [Candidatus Limnocylindrales bacterium]